MHMANNTGNDVETADQVLNRLDRQIRILENEIAKPETVRMRPQLNAQLREAKALRATIQTAIETGAIKRGDPLFDREGRPMAKPGSFLYDALKRVEAVAGKRGRGRGRGYRKQSANMVRRMAKKAEEGAITGITGNAYPGMSGYVFGLDGTTPVLKEAGRPIPGQWPIRGGSNYMVYNNSLQATQVLTGHKVPGTTKTYWGASALNAGQEMTYADGTYATSLKLPKNATQLHPGTSSSQLYIPAKGDAVAGRSGYVHSGDGSASPHQYVVGGNISWEGSGSSHVFGTDGQPVTKTAGVTIPGQTTKVFGEDLNALDVGPGVFVPGSGVHSRGGAIRDRVYLSTSPSNHNTWVAGADTPWDGNAATRFNIDGGSATVAAGDAYPGQANTVFDTDYTTFTKVAGKEVPGSSGYNAGHAETGDADGIGPAAQVYNASLNPINKTRGDIVPGDATKVYTSTGGNAAVTQPAVGSPVLVADGSTHPTNIYWTGGGASITTKTKTAGMVDPTNTQKVFDAGLVARSISTTVSDTGGRTVYRTRTLPGQDAWYAGSPYEAQGATVVVFDPSMHAKYNVNVHGGSKQAQGERPSLLLSIPAPFAALNPGDQIPLDAISVARMHPAWRDASNPNRAPDGGAGAFVPFQVAAEAGLFPGAPELWSPGRGNPDGSDGSLPREARFTVTGKETVSSGGAETQGQFVSIALGGSRSLMFNQGMRGSTSTTSSSRTSGAARAHMHDPRSANRW